MEDKNRKQILKGAVFNPAGHWNVCVRSIIKILKTGTAVKPVLVASANCSRVKLGPVPGDAGFGEFQQNVVGRWRMK